MVSSSIVGGKAVGMVVEVRSCLEMYRCARIHSSETHHM